MAAWHVGLRLVCSGPIFGLLRASPTEDRCIDVADLFARNNGVRTLDRTCRVLIARRGVAALCAMARLPDSRQEHPFSEVSNREAEAEAPCGPEDQRPSGHG
jgi:hypothetical protein